VANHTHEGKFVFYVGNVRRMKTVIRRFAEVFIESKTNKRKLEIFRK
jgi:hypothetical protein